MIGHNHLPSPSVYRRRGAVAKVLAAALMFVLSAVDIVQAQTKSPTLDTVRKRGVLNCGVNTGLAGFSAPDGRGRWVGIDADFCRAVAAAVFGNGDKVRFVPLNAKERFTALQSGEIDLLSRNTTWTMSRDTSLGLNFVGTLYYDGQAFMVRKSQKLKSVDELKGASICVQTGTTNELNLADYFETRGLTYKPVVYERLIEVLAAYSANRCDAFTTDSSQLIAERTRLPDPEAHEILSDLVSKEPLGPVVRQGDAVWSNIARWTLFLLINAEELGVTQENVMEMSTSPSPELRRIFGPGSTFGRALGLSDDWAVTVIKTVGNYGETFERNLGQGSPLKIERGRNALWTKGGLMYAPPIR